MFLPPVFLFAPCLRNPEPVKVAFANRSRVRSRLSVVWTNSVLTAQCDIEKGETVRRAILFRNERPVAQFGLSNRPLLPIAFSGKWNFEITTDGRADILTAVRHSQTNNSPSFRWTPRAISSLKSQTWMMQAALIAADRTDRIRLAAKPRERTFSPLDLVTAGSVDLGSVRLSLSDDCTIYDVGPGALACGPNALRVYSAQPEPTDAFWVEFELKDGTFAESRVIYPFAVDRTPRLMDVVETSVTLDRRSGASGPYCRGLEYLTPPDGLPISTNAIRRIRVSPLSVREIRLTADPATGKVPTKVRQWPMGAFELDAELLPAEAGSSGLDLLSRGGWQEGPELRRLSDGRLEASFCFGERTRQTVVSRFPVPTDRPVSVRLVSDCRTFAFFVDGECQGTVSLPPNRNYGNCSPVIRGVRHVSFRGRFESVSGK